MNHSRQQYTITDGIVYQIHLEQPLSPDHTSQHYIGWASNLAARWEQHCRGTAARFTQVAKERGIQFKIIRAWYGTKQFERQLKKRKEGPRLCPHCGQAIGIYPNELTPEEIQAALIPF